MPVQRAIELFAQKLSEDLQAELRRDLAAKSKNGFSGDSRLGASIRIQYLTAGDTVYGFELYLNDYYYWVNKGRKPGKGISREGQANMAKWIKIRGLIPQLSDRKTKKIKAIKDKTVRKQTKTISQEKAIKQVVFVMSKKIKEKGYEGTHFFDKVLKDGRIQTFTQYLLNQYSVDLQLEIVEPLKAA